MPSEVVVFCDSAEKVGWIMDSSCGMASRELPYVKEGEEWCDEEWLLVELVGPGGGAVVTTDEDPVPAMNGLKPLLGLDGRPKGAEFPPVGPIMGSVMLPNGSGLKRGGALELKVELCEDSS